MKALILSDVHANRAALDAVLAAEPETEKVLCLGDLVAYGPNPVECVEWAMRKGADAWLLQGQSPTMKILAVRRHIVTWRK